MIKQFIDFVIRPPRAEYNPDQYLWEAEFTLAGRKYKRQDLELRNGRGHSLQCSHYVPSPFPENTPLPCVIYCHGNSGCRADANDAAVFLLPSNITVFTLDFSGSGLSDGDYVSLGWHEKDDLKTVVSFLRSNKQVSQIGLWGRSMGAVTSLLYGAEDPSIAGMVLDSAFSDLFDLMMELVDFYKIRLPKFTIKLGVQYMRRVIQKKAKFDIMALNCIEVAPTTFIPTLFGHATEDLFIKPHHSDLIFKSYAGDKNIIKFEGGHNSPRPQFYYDSVSIFFYNVLRPPQISSTRSNKLEKYYGLGHTKVGASMNERLFYEIITGLRTMGTDAPSSSSAPSCLLNGATKVSNTSSVGISRSKSLIPFANGMDSVHDQGNTIIKLDRDKCDKPPILQDNANRQNEDYYSFSNSNRDSWGRWSSLGGESDEEFSFPEFTENASFSSVSFPGFTENASFSSVSFPVFTENASFRNEMTLQALVTPPRSILPESASKATEEEKIEVPAAVPRKPKRDRFEKWEAFSQRLRLSNVLKRMNHRRNLSS